KTRNCSNKNLPAYLISIASTPISVDTSMIYRSSNQKVALPPNSFRVLPARYVHRASVKERFLPQQNRALWPFQYWTTKCLSRRLDRKSTRLNSSHVKISYAVFCLK